VRCEDFGGCGVPILEIICFVNALLCSVSFHKGVTGGGNVGKTEAEIVL